MLSEEVLLEIFDFYLCNAYYTMEWVTLVHVCREWRSIVFSAPLRLDLRLVCLDRTPEREEMWGICQWPTLPIVVQVYGVTDEIGDEALAALECRDRVCTIFAHGVSDHKLKSLAEVTRQGPFPALKDLRIEVFDDIPVPDSLLDGSAPGLRSLYLKRATFPALGKLLLSTTRLVDLSLCDIADSVIINPETMADWLPSLTGLVKLRIKYRYSWGQLLRLDQASERPPPLTRTVLPVLTTLTFNGGSHYLDLFSSIDSPLLKHVDMQFVNPPIFDFSKISQFIGRKESFETFDQAHTMLWRGTFEVVSLWLSSRKGTTGGMWLKLSMRWKDNVWNLQSLAQVHHPFAPPLATWGHFDVPKLEDGYLPFWGFEPGYGQWLTFLRLFTAVENLYLSEGIAQYVAPVLGELAAEENAAIARDVLPALQSVFVERLDPSGFVQEAIGEFVAARGASDHPVELHRWVGN